MLVRTDNRTEAAYRPYSTGAVSLPTWYNAIMESVRTKAVRGMDQLYQTGYPHPINVFASLLLTVIPLLSPIAMGHMPGARHGLAGLVALLYLVVWSRLRVLQPDRPGWFMWIYLLAQAAAVSLIYWLDGEMTRFLFVLVGVQAVYATNARRWGPFLGVLAALWLTLYLVFSPAPGDSMVATIGLYLAYFLFAAFVTFTAVQQERQNRVAQELLDGVDQRHHTLRAYELKVTDHTEAEERERLAQTICATLLTSLTDLTGRLDGLLLGNEPVSRATVRSARLQAKDVLGAVRQTVRTLRPDEEADLEMDEGDEGPYKASPQPEVSYKWTDPVRVYHFWNIGVAVIVTGVMIAAKLVGGRPEWLWLMGAGLALLGAYALTTLSRQPWNRTLALVLQAGLIMWMVYLSREPMVIHLFLIVAAQMVFLVPPVNRWLAAAVIFPTALSGVALWLGDLFAHRIGLLLTLTAAYAVINFFGAVMAFMTKRQEEARQRAVHYAEQLAEVNRLLEARLEEVRRVAIARERVRMARDIHDGLGHHLTIVIVELQHAEALSEEDSPAALQQIREARQLIDAAMATARELVDTLERFDRPLPVAISDLIATWQKRNNVVVAIRIHGDFTALSTAARTTIYRTVQESLTNIQKHAQARRVEIALVQLADRVSLTVNNDYGGKSGNTDAGRGGFGLLGLKERADALQGEFVAKPLPGGGFQVTLVLPMGV